MLLKLFLALLAFLGYAVMWFAVFGKKAEIEKMDVGYSSSLFELIFDLTFKLSPTLIKRILIFIIGLFTAGIFALGVIFA